MMRVAFDVSVLDEREPTGVARAAEELLRALAQSAGGEELVLVAPGAIPERARAAAREAELLALPRCFPRRLWRELAAPRGARRAAIDLWHSPVTAFPLFVRCARVATVHEIALAEKELGARDGEGRLIQRARLRLATRADRVLCDSETTLARFVARHPRAAPRAVCVPLGVSFAFATCVPSSQERRAALVGGPEPYLLVLGTLRAKKDPLTALAAFAAARERLRTPLRLVFAGPAGSAAEELARAIEVRGLAGCVRIAGYVPDDELPSLVAGALALLFLSRSEGFGLPVLEAQAAGVPVIASHIDALVETSGGAALFARVDDVDAAALAIVVIATDERQRSGLIARGRANATARTWAATAAAVRAQWQEALAARDRV
ncbi:MAG: glycosyltransferase family 4 protein [Planctomycetes bacterium]|nr:glycosyltransferase family 4 protein [Planctomycetota bacterium]